jgi:hypothetical protein
VRVRAENLAGHAFAVELAETRHKLDMLEHIAEASETAVHAFAAD